MIFFQVTILVSIVCLNSVLSKPNFILIVTDDQDVFLNGLTPMEQTLKLILDQGNMFLNAFTPNPLCCPARASILTGMYVHNHATINNSMSGGCFDDYWREHIESKALPVLLKENGYETFFAGKYLNEYQSDVVPKGWDHWYGLHGNSKYYNYTLTENGILKSYGNEYLTDVLVDKTIDFLKSRDKLKPFFAMVTPPAPHAPFTAADRHLNTFNEINATKTPNFNIPSGLLDKHWLITMPPKVLPDSILSELDLVFRNRWRTLLAVDDLVSNIIAILESLNQIDDTYIIFTSDNGYHIGQFAQPYDKRQPYETDIRIPFLIRGPKISRKQVKNFPISLVDLAPTILDIAGLSIPDNMNGYSFKSVLEEPQETYFNRIILVEHWGEGNQQSHNPACPWPAKDNLSQCNADSLCKCQDSRNNTYGCVRHVSNKINKIYCEFVDNEEFVEAYDINLDPYEIENQGYSWLPSERAFYSIHLNKMIDCIGKACNVFL